MHDVLLYLRGIATDPPAESRTLDGPAAPWVFQWHHALIATAVVTSVAVAGFWGGRVTSVAEPSRGGQPILNILPFEQTLSWMGGSLSPDGQTLVAVAAPRGPEPQFLWIRRLASPAPERVDGSDGAMYPFWSPDGREVGFFTRGGKLKRLNVGTPGSVPLDVCDVEQGRGGVWFDDGTSVFTEAERGWLKRVSASGGEVALLLPFDETLGFFQFRYPVRVGARQVLFLAVAADTSRSELRLASLDVPGKSTSVVPSSMSAAYANGFLFFDRNGVAVAQRFETDTGTLTGEPIVVTGYVNGDGNIGYRHFLAGERTVAWWADRPDGTALAYSRTLAGEQQICLDTFPAERGCRPLAWSAAAGLGLSELHWRGWSRADLQVR